MGIEKTTIPNPIHPIMYTLATIINVYGSGKENPINDKMKKINIYSCVKFVFARYKKNSSIDILKNKYIFYLKIYSLFLYNKR